MVRETGKPIAQVTRELGINEGTLGNWVNVAAPAGERQRRLSEDERVRKERAELRMRCAI